MLLRWASLAALGPTAAAASSNHGAPLADPAVMVSVGAQPIGVVNNNYASFNVDSSFNRGFFHINFTNANLRAAAASLAPATLRFGGSGNDYLHYDVGGGPGGCAPNVTDSDTYGCLNATHWDALFALAADAGIDFLFGLSYDLGTACARDLRTPYVWNASDALRMVTYIASARQTVWGFELGNEVNNRGTGGSDFCNVTAEGQAAAFVSLYRDVLQVVYNNSNTTTVVDGAPPVQFPRIVGPDSGCVRAQRRRRRRRRR
jgi:hypothetical protein